MRAPRAVAANRLVRAARCTFVDVLPVQDREDQYVCCAGYLEDHPIITDPQLPISPQRTCERNAVALRCRRQSGIDRSRDPSACLGGNWLEVLIGHPRVISEGV